MKTLQQCNWKPFRIEEIFEVKGTITTHPSVLAEKGKTPRITCAATNNGLDGFYENQPTEHGNVLTVDSATIGFVSYQESSFIATDHVEKLVPKYKSFNRHIALFIKECIDKAKDNKFGYGYKFSQGRIKRQTIMLPSTPEGEPDYVFMEKYMRQKEQTIIGKYKAYISYIADNQQLIGGGELSNVNWKEFRIGDVFTIESGVRLTAANMKLGKRPFIGATDSNNGITAFVDNSNNSLDSNALGVNYNGSVVENFYHPYEAVFSDDVKRLHLKEEQGNRFIYLFIKQCILMQKTKYQYGYKFNGERMKKQFIMLPCTPEDTPDWQYMESYMRNVESQQILKYLEHLNACI